jgi:hypothetical protein
VRVRTVLAALIASLVLAVSVYSVSCDLSCVLSQLSSSCGHENRLAEPMQMPMQMEGMTHSHHARQSELGQLELETILVSSNMSSCPHHPCDKPATSVQTISSATPRSAHAILVVIANLQLGSTLVAVSHPHRLHLRTNLSALDPLSTSLRV